MDNVTIYTDGACSGNPGPGGWGALMQFGENERELKGGEPQTTNNRMELFAAIAALEALKRPCTVNLHTDSTYLRNGITSWIHRWKANGWKTAAKKQNDMPADQLHLYEMAVQATGLVKDFDLPIRLGFRVITKTKDPDFQILNVESSTQQQERLKAKMGACVKGMKAGIVYPNPGWQCGSCPFKRHCAVWPDVDSIAGTFPRKI